MDSATMMYPKSRLAEAYTGSPSSKTTDLGFSYSNRGEVAAVYQSSPHSGGYYNIAATYWAPQGLLDTLNPNTTGIPTWTYVPEGEGRVNTVSASSGTNPVSGTSYNGFSEVMGITFGSADSDAFTYDPNTGRMTQYKANVGSSSMTGTPTWNANWTLGTLGIVDGLNSKDTQSCTYAYDSLARLTSAGCGSTIWSQSFSYDAFGNITKTGSQSFGPTYSETTNRYTAIGSVTPTYDSNGNVTYDGFYNYTWDSEGNLATLDGNTETYDALDRRVEQSSGGVYTEIVYGVDGSKLGLMNTQTVTKVFTPLPDGATAVYTSSGLSYYRHPDWLGSSRLASTPSHGIYYDGAYAPYGEAYAETGTTDRNFTGQNQDLTPGSTGDLYDFRAREYHPTQGRWVSPDPAGMGAVDPTNPQSWNRYAYVMNNPNGLIDPLGLDGEGGTEPGWAFLNCGSGSFTITFKATNLAGAVSLCNALQSALGPTYFFGAPAGGGSGPGQLPPCNDANNNRSRFFQQLPGLLDVSEQLNVPSKYLVGLSSYESGWLDNHNNALNNLWGLTQNGGNNMSFTTKQLGNAYFVKRVGPYIQGAQTLPAFFAGLQNEGYNSKNPDYFNLDPSKGVLSNRISNIEKWGQACGVSF